MTTLRLPAKPENVGKLLEFVSGLATQYGFPAAAVKEIELAAEEALINILHYAYPEETGEVEIRRRGDDGTRLELEIVDYGIPFDPLSLSEPDLAVNVPDRKVGGLGVMLIREMADGVRYRRDGGANILTLIFQKSLLRVKPDSSC